MTVHLSARRLDDSRVSLTVVQGTTRTDFDLSDNQAVQLAEELLKGAGDVTVGDVLDQLQDIIVCHRRLQ